MSVVVIKYQNLESKNKTADNKMIRNFERANLGLSASP